MSDERDYEDLAPGESYRSLGKPSAPSSGGRVNDPVSGSTRRSRELETSGQPWWFHRCLTKTDPATLFIIAIGLLFMAAVCMVIGVKLTSGVTLEQAINLQGVSEWSVPAQAERSITRNLLGISANAIGALCGLIGGLLPMWAVGRLIADAINSRSEP